MSERIMPMRPGCSRLPRGSRELLVLVGATIACGRRGHLFLSLSVDYQNFGC